MKIAIFIPSLCGGGGAERVVITLAKGLVQQGLDIDLVLADSRGPFPCDVPSSIRLIDLKANRTFKCLPGLIKYLRKEKPFAMLSNLDHANVVALLSRRISRVKTKIIVVVHNSFPINVKKASNRLSMLIPLVARRLYPQAECVVAVSQAVAGDLCNALGLSRKKVYVIYNPIVTPDLYRLSQKPLKHPWFRTNSPPVILGVGRLTKQKDFSTLIRAFSLVLREREARLLILGEGEERERLEKLIAKLGLCNDVSLCGYVENPYPYMAHAAMLVLSSRWEGLPTVLVEAMALGTPVISTDCPGGSREILEGGKYGKLVPVGDIETLAAAIIETLDHPTDRSVLKARANLFSMEKALQEYIGVLTCRGESTAGE